MIGLAYACCSCGWREDVGEDGSAHRLIAEHRDVCEDERRFLLVPMWSVAWPYYWEQERRREAGEDPLPFGLEMDYRVVGSHTASAKPYPTGGDAKEWFLFRSDTGDLVAAQKDLS